MGKKHDELMAEIKLVHQEIFDLRCEIDQIENLLSSVRTIRWKIKRPGILSGLRSAAPISAISALQSRDNVDSYGQRDESGVMVQ